MLRHDGNMLWTVLRFPHTDLGRRFSITRSSVVAQHRLVSLGPSTGPKSEFVIDDQSGCDGKNGGDVDPTHVTVGNVIVIVVQVHVVVTVAVVVVEVIEVAEVDITAGDEVVIELWQQLW